MAPPSKNATLKQGHSLQNEFLFRRKTPVRKAKSKIKDTRIKEVPQRRSSKYQQGLHKWNSLLCTTNQNNPLSPQKSLSCLPAAPSSYFPGSPLKSSENSDRHQAPTITVYTEPGGRQHQFSFDSITKAKNICHDTAAIDNSNIDDVTDWCLIECIFNGKLERLIEDHEIIASVCRKWDPIHTGYFIFRVDSSKHGPVLSPEMAYSVNVLDDKDDDVNLPQEALKAKNHLLREYLKSTQRFPDLQGPAFIRDGTKSNWKKYILFMRGSGLYFCPRRQMKDPKNLKPLCKYDNIDVYIIKQDFHLIKCPTSFCIAIKMNHQRGCEFEELKFVAFTTQKDLDKWTLALRMAKHGEQLQINYDESLLLKTQLEKLRKTS